MKPEVLSEQEVLLITQSFSKVLPISDTAAELFYGRLFEINPSVKPLFRGDMKEQGRKLMSTIGTAVASARRPRQLTKALEELAARHVGYGVKPAHFNDVGAALLWTLEQGLGPDFTPETRVAWSKLYVSIVDIMMPVFVAPSSPEESAVAPQVAAARENRESRSQPDSVQRPEARGWWTSLLRFFGLRRN